MQGAFHLHYSQPSGRVDWKTVSEALQQKPMQAVSKILPQPEEGSIAKLAQRLGLLHRQRKSRSDGISGDAAGLLSLRLEPGAAFVALESPC